MGHTDCYLGRVPPRKRMLERIYAKFAMKVLEDGQVLAGIDRRPLCEHWVVILGDEEDLIALQMCFLTEAKAQTFCEEISGALDQLIVSRLQVQPLEINPN